MPKTTPSRLDVGEVVPDSPFAVIGKTALTIVVCVVVGLAIGLILLKLLIPVFGTLRAGSIAIPVALVGCLVTIH